MAKKRKDENKIKYKDESTLVEHNETNPFEKNGYNSEEMVSGSLRMLLAPGIKNILIKGIPGTGKTTLATRLLEFAASGSYISSRVGLKKLFEHNGRLKKGETDARLNKSSLELEKVSYQDVRLGFVEDVMKKVVGAISERKELIILDSWDTIAKEMDRVERLKHEKIIASMIDASESRCIFVSEEPELTSTDFLADAIVSLGYLDVEGRRLREITWEKIRGQPIPSRKQLYTLKDGRFAVGEVIFTRGVYDRKYVPIPNGRDYLSTGSRDFDEFFGGGLRRGLFVAVEFGKMTGNDWHGALYDMIGSNFIHNGGYCISVPPPSVTPQMVLSSMTRLVGERLAKSRLRVVSYVKPVGNHPSLVDVSGRTPEEAYNIQHKAANDLRAAHGNKPLVWFLSMDTYEAFGGSERSSDASFMARGTAVMKQHGDVTFALVKPSTSALQPVSDNCDIHLKFEAIDNSLVMYSKRPPSEPYVLIYDFSSGYPQVILNRII